MRGPWIGLICCCLWHLCVAQILRPQIANPRFAMNNPTLTTVALEKPFCVFDGLMSKGTSYEVFLYIMVESALDFFLNNSKLLTTYMSTNFIVNVPKCVSSSRFSPATVRLAVALVDDSATLPGVIDTEQIENLRKTPQATTYFAGEFKSVSCRITRDLLVMDIDDSQYELITIIGYQVGTEYCRQTKGPFCNQVLKPSTFYRVNFFFLDDKSAIRAHTDWSAAIQTRNVTNYESADVMFEGRAGGMIVITILVSIGGAVLVIALIVAVALSNKK